MSGAPAPFPAWEQLSAAPAVAGVMRRYLEQIGCVLRPRSVENADQALRCFAGLHHDHLDNDHPHNADERTSRAHTLMHLRP